MNIGSCLWLAFLGCIRPRCRACFLSLTACLDLLMFDRLIGMVVRRLVSMCCVLGMGSDLMVGLLLPNMPRQAPAFRDRRLLRRQLGVLPIVPTIDCPQSPLTCRKGTVIIEKVVWKKTWIVLLTLVVSCHRVTVRWQLLTPV